jgi:phosphoribosylcarboxyaminoimidazole (NCAIR) mutase
VRLAHHLVTNLQAAGIIKGGFGVPACGSDSDIPRLEKSQVDLTKFGIPSQIRVCSTHMQPARLQALVEQLNQSAELILMEGCASGTVALSDTASYPATFPVVSWPPEGANGEVSMSCLMNPPGSSNAFICETSNIGKFAAQFMALHMPEVVKALDVGIGEEVRKLEQTDGRWCAWARAAPPSRR